MGVWTLIFHNALPQLHYLLPSLVTMVPSRRHRIDQPLSFLWFYKSTLILSIQQKHEVISKPMSTKK